MKRDNERIEQITRALKAARLDALICALPMNVLMLSGYWPVVGTSIAILTSDGEAELLVPEDERELAKRGWADTTTTFSTGSLSELKTLIEAVEKPLQKLIGKLGIRRIGVESGPANEPATYAAMNLYGSSIQCILGLDCQLIDADEMLERLRSRLTSGEMERVRAACRVAADAFDIGAANIRTGISEIEAAETFRAKLNVASESIGRSIGQVFCMSGPNSYEAYAAFQISRSRRLRSGDLALVHCNSCIDGFWTDVTRTYFLGEPGGKERKIYAAIFAARDAAIAAVGPGVRAADIDTVARNVLRGHGFGKEFKHGLGHAVGFQAIDHNAPPRLHPASPDILEAGMVFNIEPAIYIEGFGGARHCDMILVTEKGAEALTPFQDCADEMVIGYKEGTNGRSSSQLVAAGSSRSGGDNFRDPDTL